MCIRDSTLTALLRGHEALAYGGDEFVVFVPSVGREILETRLQQLCEAFQQPYRNGSLIYQISGSVGAALFPDDGKDYKTLLEHADEALYEDVYKRQSLHFIWDCKSEALPQAAPWPLRPCV